MTMSDAVKREIKEWIQTLVVALALALVVRTFIVAAFKIPTGSMRPTLMEGDKIFVNKFIYRFHEPARGDVIVFKYPENPKKDYVKRLIGFGGEELEIKDGKVWVDGQPLDRLPFTKVYYYNRGPYGGEGQKVKVPPNSLFALGDNSANSRDSREWGFVPRKNLVGKAFVIWWPPTRIHKIE